jgi:hypothetical protein
MSTRIATTNTSAPLHRLELESGMAIDQAEAPTEEAIAMPLSGAEQALGEGTLSSDARTKRAPSQSYLLAR